jgi:hypothetical protein
MAVKDGPKIFHASMHVTRVEEWFVEAQTKEEARKLLESGGGHRSHVGECVQIEFAEISE